jgi:filamentous hemagglutinin family protein
MKSRLDRSSILRNAAWCALPALAVFSAATAPAAAGHQGTPGAGRPAVLHPVAAGASSGLPLALGAGLSTHVPVLRVGEAKSFGYLSARSMGILPMHSNPRLPEGNGGSSGRRQGVEAVASSPQGGSAAHRQDAHAAGAAEAIGGIVLDNTLVTADLEPVSGVYAITPNFGKQAGGNLFFSFSSFSLAQGQTARFQPGTVPFNTPVQNVLVRVTGNNPSNIDGQIACTIPSAGFFFMNPAGVTFTANASLNLTGALALTTADYIRFADNTTFAATNPAGGASLSMSSPAAFGFLGVPRGGLSIDGATLQPPDGTAILAVAGPVQLSNSGALYCPGGNVSVVSVGSAGEVGFNSLLQVTKVGNPTLGAITLSSDAAIYSDSDPAGPVNVICDTLTMTGGASITANSLAGTGDAGKISVTVNGLLKIQGYDSNGFDSEIIADSAFAFDSSALTSGKGGNITVSAGSMQLLDGGFIGSITFNKGNAGNLDIHVSGQALFSDADSNISDSGLYANTSSSDTGGDAGAITFSANSLHLINGGSINAFTFGHGKGGNINVTIAGQLLMAGDDPGGAESGIFANTVGDGNGGNAGSIKVMAGSLQMSDGAGIGSVTFNNGKSGDIDVNVTGSAVLSGSNSLRDTRITAVGGPGASGSITFTAGSLQLTDGAAITSSTTAGLGKAGSVTINVSGPATFSGADSTNDPSGVFSESDADGKGGDAGAITFTANSLQLTGGGTISTITSSLGKGGAISVMIAGKATMAGNDAAFDDSGILANTIASVKGGDAGSIKFVANSLEMTGGAAIGSVSFNNGKGGDIDVQVSGNASLSGRNAQRDTRIAAAGGTGDAGSITFSAGSLQLTGGAGINSMTSSLGKGGNVTVNVAGAAVIDGADSSGEISGVFADSTAQGNSGNAGSIILKAASLQLTGGAEIISSTSGTGNGGGVTIIVAGNAVIDGAASSGDSGVFAGSFATGSGGAAGSVSFTAANLQITNGAGISSGTAGLGNGGNIVINVAGQTMISGTDAQNRIPGIFARSSSTSQGGGAGSIMLNTGTLMLANQATISSSTFGLGKGGDVTISVAGQATIDGLSGVFSDSNATGAGGDGGKILFSAASLGLTAGAQISADSHGVGNAGNLTVQISGLAMLDGGGASGFTGITSQSLATTSGGNAGPISFGAGQLQVANGAQISSATNGTGAGGDANVTVAGAASFSGGGNAGAAGLVAISNSTGAGGPAGKVALQCDTLTLSNGAVISSRSLGQGIGGTVSINASTVSLTGNSSVSATAMVAGNVTVTSGSIQLAGGSTIATDTVQSSPNGSDISIYTASLSLDGSTISAQTSGAGNGGSVHVNPVAANGPLAVALTDNAVISAATSGSGTGGSIAVAAGTFSADGSRVAASSSGAGRAGSVNVTTGGMLSMSGSTVATNSMLSDGGSVTLTGAAGVSISSGSTVTAQAAGNAGNVTLFSPAAVQMSNSQIQAQTLGLTADARGGDIAISGATIQLTHNSISATAANQGTGGDITLTSGSFLAERAAMISASNSGSGAAGSVTLTIADDATITRGASLAATAAQNAGGDVTISAGNVSLSLGAGISTKSPGAGGNIGVNSRSNLVINSATISAEAGELGNISLNARQLMSINSSTITARTVGKGGQIAIDPQDVLLQHSIINGLASGGQDVKVKFAPTVLLVQSGDSRIESNDVVLPPGTDVSGALIALPGVMPQASLSLAPVCAPRLDAQFSSFVVTGAGGRPPGPEGWMPDLIPADGTQEPSR